MHPMLTLTYGVAYMYRCANRTTTRGDDSYTPWGLRTLLYTSTLSQLHGSWGEGRGKTSFNPEAGHPANVKCVGAADGLHLRRTVSTTVHLVQ